MTADEVKLAFLAESPERKLRIVSALAYNLTVGARGAYPGLVTEPQAATRLRSLNEVQHTVAAKLMNDLGGGSLGFPDEAFLDVLFDKARIWGCEPQVLAALQRSLAPEG
jgi:hypothetical protein